ncbi:hypothetical protein Syun_015702 [Stephania yunnanensis]|uniref:Acidic leucine-rich nuclear phosphoprotein 32-related protein n=1 Tax=Stephania yunnanensis TaxID=152371 RepID=A0AAP0P9Z5_9MAGN
MDEIWERAVETALEGQADVSARSLTLDGAVKCYQGRLPPSSLLEKFENLEHLSIANVGVSSLENFPHLRNLQRLILSDNRIAGGLEFLVAAGLESLRDLDLSNNRIQSVEDLEPLARLHLVSLDLYECPVTRVRDYRSKVFGLIRSLKYLDKMDVEENERPESDEEEEEDDDPEEEEGEEDDEDDPGSGEIDGEDRSGKVGNGMNGGDGVYDVDEDEESDEDEEEGENVGVGNRSSGSSAHSHLNGSTMVDAIDGDENDDEVNEEEGEDDDDVVEVHEIDDSGDEEDGVDDEEDESDEKEEVDTAVKSRLTSSEGEIDGHDYGEEDENDENGEIGEEDENGEVGEVGEDQGVGEDAEFDEDDGEEWQDDESSEFLVQPVSQADKGSDFELNDGEGDSEEDIEDGEKQQEKSQPQPSSSHPKRKRGDESNNEDVDVVKSRKR